MKKVLCKRNYLGFKKGEIYEVFSINSIFEKDDFISIASSKDHITPTPVYRFRMNKSLEYIEDYIGENENYFYDYFCNIKEERKTKIQHLSK
jgi:hypothetical protein